MSKRNGMFVGYAIGAIIGEIAAVIAYGISKLVNALYVWLSDILSGFIFDRTDISSKKKKIINNVAQVALFICAICCCAAAGLLLAKIIPSFGDTFVIPSILYKVGVTA